MLEPRLMLAVLHWQGDVPDGTVWRSNDVHVLTDTCAHRRRSHADDRRAGTVVKMNCCYFNGIKVSGTLTADGTPEAPSSSHRSAMIRRKRHQQQW